MRRQHEVVWSMLETASTELRGEIGYGYDTSENLVVDYTKEQLTIHPVLKIPNNIAMYNGTSV